MTLFQRFRLWLGGLILGDLQNPYFVAVREGRALSRVEELPSGRQVFYVDVTDVPLNCIEDYLKQCKKNIAKSDRISMNTEVASPDRTRSAWSDETLFPRLDTKLDD